MLSQVYDKSNLGKRTKDESLEVQGRAGNGDRMFWRKESRTVAGLPRQGFPRCRGCAAYQQKNLWIRATKRETIKTRLLYAPFPHSSSAILTFNAFISLTLRAISQAYRSLICGTFSLVMQLVL